VLSYEHSGNEFRYISIKIQGFDPLPPNEEFCGEVKIAFNIAQKERM